MRSVLEQVCQSLIVVSYWSPGSAHDHAASPILPHKSRALIVRAILPSFR